MISLPFVTLTVYKYTRTVKELKHILTWALGLATSRSLVDDPVEVGQRGLDLLEGGGVGHGVPEEAAGLPRERLVVAAAHKNSVSVPRAI